MDSLANRGQRQLQTPTPKCEPRADGSWAWDDFELKPEVPFCFSPDLSKNPSKEVKGAILPRISNLPNSPIPTTTPTAGRAKINSFNYNWDYNELGPESASWDCRGMTRMQTRTYVKTLLDEGAPGEFVIRDKDSESGYALTVKLEYLSREPFATFLIEEVGGKVCLKGTPDWESFSKMVDLVNFYASAERPSLGMQLKIPANLWGVSPTKEWSDKETYEEQYVKDPDEFVADEDDGATECERLPSDVRSQFSTLSF